jgi:aryl-alcohol dehydrogenase-like predicted oxidoreductase
MEYRKLGETSLEITPIAFGAWAAGGWMWGGTDQQEAVAAIRRSVELGVTTIDTAPVYGFGLSEQIVGEAIRGMRDGVQILTKFGMRWDTDKGLFAFDSEDAQGRPAKIYKYAGRDSVIWECEESLRRLGTDYIDLLQIHWPDPTTPIDETFEVVSRLLDAGKIRAAGVSNYDAQQLEEARRVMPIASNQVPYSMVKRDIETDLVPYCLQHHVGILAYSPLQRGLLTGKMRPGHAFAPGDHRAGLPYFKDEYLARTARFLDTIKPLADEKGCTLSQLVIAWTIRQPGITCALVGARNPKQAEENAAAGNVQLSRQEIEQINAHLGLLEMAP